MPFQQRKYFMNEMDAFYTPFHHCKFFLKANCHLQVVSIYTTTEMDHGDDVKHDESNVNISETE